MKQRLLVALLLVLSALTVQAGHAAAADPLQVGVGRADITSPLGYFMQGWVRSDAVLNGVNTRIEARAIVLKRGSQKIALVAEDLNGIAGGVVKEASIQLAKRGFSEANIIVSASHTHAAPSGYYNFGTYNTVFMTKNDLLTQNVQGAMDPTLYAFEVRQLVLAITRADDDLGPGKLGWATTQLSGLTANRSLEAHLRDHGITKAKGTGKVSDDPKGYLDTIDPEVQVLRVDKDGVGPVGMWSTFADHGTVNKYEFGYYNADHHGSATRVVEQQIRALGRVPAGQDVVNAYGNTDEGDQSAGLTRSGPAAADEVGRVEATKMLAAWKDAGRHLTNTPVIRLRWTRMCFCGQDTAAGKSSPTATPGLPLFTGSEEGRGPLYDLTTKDFEGRSAEPVNNPLDPAQGYKIPVSTGLVSPGSTPKAVPLAVLQVGERLIATIPGEMTVDMGRRVRGALGLITQGHGIKAIQLSGIANEYLSYFTSPQEYDAQHYEGGSTMYGRTSSVAMMQMLQVLTMDLVGNKPAPAAYDADPRNGVVNSNARFPTGAASAAAVTQPESTQRLQRASFSWTGGVKGYDMPLGRAFVTVERVGHGAVASDLGLEMLWKLSDTRYTASWEIPRSAALGSYRFVVTGNHYRLVSSAFTVTAATTLSVQGKQVRYPDAVVNVDLTYRPGTADGAKLTAVGASVAPGHAFDRYGNCNGAAATTTGPRAGADPRADSTVCAQARTAIRSVTPAPRGSLAATGGAPWVAALAFLLLAGAAFWFRRRSP